MPVASGGIHVWHMPALVDIFGDDACLQFGGGTLGHPWGNAPGAVANRVALEACVQARNEGRTLASEGGDIIRAAAKWSPELAAACEVWKEIKFEFLFFQSGLNYRICPNKHPWAFSWKSFKSKGWALNRVSIYSAFYMEVNFNI